MKNLTTILLLLLTFISKAQNIQLALGPSYSKLDWQFKYHNGELEDFYLASTFGLAANINFEYLEKKWFSITSNLGYFQSGGQIASHEVHQNWLIPVTKNSASNFSIGTSFNFIPLNNQLQLMIGIGPRIDYLIPAKNSAMDVLEEDLNKIQLGLTGSLAVFYKFEKAKIGLSSSYLNRLTKLIDREPTTPGNWWESQKLGVKAKDELIMNFQFVIAFQL